MHPVESENEVLTDGRTDTPMHFFDEGYNIIPRTF